MARRLPWIPFYIDDWIGGTMLMDRRTKGAYLDLLLAQASNGHLSEESVKHMLRDDFDCWKLIKFKFIQDELGLWFNERMQDVVDKRIAYLSSRKDNGSHKHTKLHMQVHMQGHMPVHMGVHSGCGYGSGSSTAVDASKALADAQVLGDKPDPEQALVHHPARVDNTWAAACPHLARVREAYPKVVKVYRALESWAVLINRGLEPQATADAIVEAVAWQRATLRWQRDNGKYIPDLSAYLDNGEWLSKRNEAWDA